MKTLREAKAGETVKVVKLHGEGAVKRRMMDPLPVVFSVGKLNDNHIFVKIAIFSQKEQFIRKDGLLFLIPEEDLNGSGSE